MRFLKFWYRRAPPPSRGLSHGREASWPGKHAIELSAPAGTGHPPLQQHLPQRRAHRHLAPSGLGLGEIDDRAVVLLGPPDADDIGLEIDVLPQEGELLAWTRAGEEGKGVVDAVPLVGAGRLEEGLDLLRREDRLLELCGVPVRASWACGGHARRNPPRQGPEPRQGTSWPWSRHRG